MNVENRHKNVERHAAFQADVPPDLSIGAEGVKNVNQPDCAPRLLRRFGFERPPLATTVVGGRDRSRDPKTASHGPLERVPARNSAAMPSRGLSRGLRSGQEKLVVISMSYAGQWWS
jgi:hypothetical protein